MSSVETDSEVEREDRRTSFRAAIVPQRELAVVKRRRREFTVWIRNVSSGGVGFVTGHGSSFRVDDKIVVVTSSGTFEGRVAHVTPDEDGKHLVGVQRVKILEELHAQIVDRGDLPRTPNWIPSLIGWTATSAAICAGFFFLETSGAFAACGIRTSLAAPVVAESAIVDRERELAQRFRRIDALHDPAAISALGLSIRDERHVVAIAEQTSISLASLYLKRDEMDRGAWSHACLAAIEVAEERILERLDAEQRALWQAPATK